MSENINIDFVPDKRKNENGRLSDIEEYLKLLTDRTKFCFSQLNEAAAEEKSAGQMAIENPFVQLGAGEELQAHTAADDNPHNVTKSQIGLENADNTSDIDKPVSKAMREALDLKADKSTLTAHTENTDNPHSVTKAQIGLGNADNTSDIDKPVSTAAQTAINDAVSAIEIGGTNLLRDSTGNLKTGWNSSLIVDGGGIGGNNCINVYRENSTASTYFIGYFHDEAELFSKLISDDEYVLGAWFRIKSDIPLDSDNNGIRIYQRDDENAVVATTNIYITRDDPTEIWFYRKIRFKFNALMKKPVFNLFLGQNGHFEVCNIKLERGNKDTAWSPSPDDFQTQINSLEERIAALEAVTADNQ